MDMAAGSAQSAVDSLLGRLSTVLVEETQLLRGVHGDVQFIKREMESMNGFLLDAASEQPRPGHQVRAWTRQVHELAYDSRNCVDRYVQTMGPSRPSAGVVASLLRVPKLVRTLPDRHRIAMQIRELKARALEVGERRQRYGIVMETRAVAAGGIASGTATAAKREAEDERRRHALAGVEGLFNTDMRVKELVTWLRGGPVARGTLRRNQMVTAGQLVKKLITGHGGRNDGQNLAMELMKLLRVMCGDDNPESVAEAAGYLREAMKEVDKEEVRVFSSWLLDLVFGRDDHPVRGSTSSDSKGKKHAKQHQPSDILEMIKAATTPMEVARLEARYMAEQIWWLIRLFKNEFIEEHVFHHQHHPKVLFIVAPPVDEDDSDGEELADEMNVTELARKVFYHPSAGKEYFNIKVWVDPGPNPDHKKWLQSILHELLLQSGVSHDSERMSTSDRHTESKLKDRIRAHLYGKRFLIVLAGPVDQKSWPDIIHDLPEGSKDGGSAVIVTPSIHATAEFHGWYTASWFFLLMGASRYHVHFCSNLVAVRKVAAQLVTSEKLQGSINAILKKCHWDSYSTKMFLHALHANPHRSKEELDRLLFSLRQSSRVGNARRMIMFCYDDLSSQYQSCLLSLSMFPPDARVKRTNLARRWAAENFVARRDGLSAVDEAERCFDALITRGLLNPSDVGPAGKVKSCTVHPYVFSFLTKTTSEENKDNTHQLPPDLARRLSTHSGLILLLENQMAANSNTCWGIHWHRSPTASKDKYNDLVTFLNLLPASTDQLGLVKVLDLQGCKGLKKSRLKTICNKIFQLKYLSLRDTDATELPKEINKLRYLETLDIRQAKIQSFPAKSIFLPKLMHLLAGHVDHQNLEATESDISFSTVHLPRGLASMTNMNILSHVEVSESDEDLEELINVGRKLHLRKLGVVILGNKEDRALKILLRVVAMLHEFLCSLSVRIEAVHSDGDSHSKEGKVDGVQASNYIMNTDDMGQSPPKSLESLNIKGKISGLPDWVKQLHRLSKITLCCTYLTQSDIGILGELVNLRCIRLRQHSYVDKKLNLDAKKFKKLLVLVIEGSHISSIYIDDSAAPKLERIAWTFIGVQIAIFGINKLKNLREVQINGNCSPNNLSRIAQDMEMSPSHPILMYNTTRETVAVAPSKAFI